jgi:hypothetical protein
MQCDTPKNCIAEEDQVCSIALIISPLQTERLAIS